MTGTIYDIIYIYTPYNEYMYIYITIYIKQYIPSNDDMTVTIECTCL